MFVFFTDYPIDWDPIFRILNCLSKIDEVVRSRFFKRCWLNSVYFFYVIMLLGAYCQLQTDKTNNTLPDLLDSGIEHYYSAVKLVTTVPTFTVSYHSKQSSTTYKCIISNYIPYSHFVHYVSTVT